MGIKGSLIVFIIGIIIGWSFGNGFSSTSISNILGISAVTLGGIAIVVKGRRDIKKACEIDPSLCK